MGTNINPVRSPVSRQTGIQTQLDGNFANNYCGLKNIREMPSECPTGTDANDQDWDN